MTDTTPSIDSAEVLEATEAYRADSQRRHDTPWPKQSTKKTLRKARDAKAMKMRMGGATLPKIVEECGYPSIDSARSAIERAVNKRFDENADALRVVEDSNLEYAAQFVMGVIKAERPLPGLEGLEDLLATADRRDVEKRVEALLEAATANAELRLRAVDRIINIGARKGKLWGYDAPTKQEISGDSGIINVVFDANVSAPQGMNEPELIVEQEK